jgi:CPA2 family monovalent cation:H+ antiporter-2
MLFGPAFVLAEPWKVLAVVAVIVIAKPLAAFAVVAALRRPIRTGLIVAAGLAQIGEFSFILAALGRSLGLLPEEGYSLILAGAILSITLNPILFRVIGPLETWLRDVAQAARSTTPMPAGSLTSGPASDSSTDSPAAVTRSSTRSSSPLSGTITT